MKAYFVTTDVEIHAVSCPGVWLCPTGEVCLRISTKDDFFTTKTLPAKFPLVYHETFMLSKYYYGVTTLKQLEEEILDEPFRITLNQDGKKLAYFKGTLEALLSPPIESDIPGVDIHILLDPTRIFPGILSPKVELSTRTTIRETYCKVPKSRALVIERRQRNSELKSPRRTKPVCHSRNYHQYKNCRTKSAPSENVSVSASSDTSHEPIRYCRKPCSQTVNCNSLIAKASSKNCQCKERPKQRKPYNADDYQVDSEKDGGSDLSQTKSYLESILKYDNSSRLKLYKAHIYDEDCNLCDRYDNYFGRYTKISYEPCLPKPCPSLADRLHERLEIVLRPSKENKHFNACRSKIDNEKDSQDSHKNLRKLYNVLNHKASSSSECGNIF